MKAPTIFLLCFAIGATLLGPSLTAGPCEDEMEPHSSEQAPSLVEKLKAYVQEFDQESLSKAAKPLSLNLLLIQLAPVLTASFLKGDKNIVQTIDTTLETFEDKLSKLRDLPLNEEKQLYLNNLLERVRKLRQNSFLVRARQNGGTH